MWRKRNPHALLVGMQTGAATMKNSMDVPQKVKNRTIFDPTIALLGTNPKNTKTLIQRDTCTPMFIAAVFTMARLQEEPKCPSIDGWIKKMWGMCVCV